MFKKTGLLPLVLLFGLSSLVNAAPVKLLGFDDMSCQAWAKSKADTDQRQLYVAWVRGLLSGHNYAHQSQQVSAISSGTVEQYINRYCTEKPLGEFSDAALRLSDQFSGRNAPITK
jgi:proline dehydrogenase